MAPLLCIGQSTTPSNLLKTLRYASLFDIIVEAL